jgi:hypothetical protein
MPEFRSGLALFLRRGMWGWCQALTTIEEPRNPSRSSRPAAIMSDQHTTAVQILAAIAMDCNHRRKL